MQNCYFAYFSDFSHIFQIFRIIICEFAYAWRPWCPHQSGISVYTIATRLSDNTIHETTNPHKPNTLFRTCTGYNVLKRVQCISGPLQAKSQSLEATVCARTIVFHHLLVHIIRLTNPCVNWWLGGYMGLQIAKDMQCTVIACARPKNIGFM